MLFWKPSHPCLSPYFLVLSRSRYTTNMVLFFDQCCWHINKMCGSKLCDREQQHSPIPEPWKFLSVGKPGKGLGIKLELPPKARVSEQEPLNFRSYRKPDSKILIIVGVPSIFIGHIFQNGVSLGDSVTHKVVSSGLCGQACQHHSVVLVLISNHDNLSLPCGPYHTSFSLLCPIHHAWTAGAPHSSEPRGKQTESYQKHFSFSGHFWGWGGVGDRISLCSSLDLPK